MDLRRQFDATGPAYAESQDKYFTKKQDWARGFIFQHLGNARDILDLGCGHGVDLQTCTAWGALATGVDASLAMARIARARGAVVVGYIEDLPFRDRAFDAAFSRFGFHYAASLDRSSEECARVLRPGGRLIVVGPHPACEALRHNAHREQKLIEVPLYDGAVTVRYPTHTLAQWLSPRFLDLFALEELQEYAGEGEERTIEPTVLGLAARKR